jgi:hypothetical protein
MERAREAAEGRKTSALAQSRSRTLQSIPDLVSPARIPKKFPDRTAPHPCRRSFPTPQGHDHPGRTPPTPNLPPRSPPGLHRGNMTADTSKSTYNGLAWPSRSSHVIVDGVSIPLQGSALLAQREAAAVTHDTPTLGILPFAPDPYLLQHINTHIYGLHAPVLTTVFLLLTDDVCLVVPQPQLLHDL